MKNLTLAAIIIFSSHSFACGERVIGEVKEINDISAAMFAVFEDQFDNVKRPKPPKCPSLESIKDKDQLIFNFEGAGGYSPKGLELEKFMSKIDAKGTYDLKNKCLAAGISEQCEKVIKKTWGETVIAFPLGMDMMKPYLKDESTQFMYYSQKHVGKSFKCIESLLEEAKLTKTELPALKVMGYSWGGNAAMKFVKKLGKKFPDLPIKSMFTVDPVRKGVGVLKNLFGNKDSKYFTKQKNVEHHINIYQKSDRISFGAGIKGNKVQGADDNYLFQSSLRGGSADYDHLNVSESEQANKMMKEFIQY